MVMSGTLCISNLSLNECKGVILQSYNHISKPTQSNSKVLATEDIVNILLCSYSQ